MNEKVIKEGIRSNFFINAFNCTTINIISQDSNEKKAKSL